MKRLLIPLLFLALPAQAAERFTVMLDWFVNPDHAPIIVAQEAGFFARAGLDVRIVAPADPNDPPRLVAAIEAICALPSEPIWVAVNAPSCPASRLGKAAVLKAATCVTHRPAICTASRLATAAVVKAPS